MQTRSMLGAGLFAVVVAVPAAAQRAVPSATLADPAGDVHQYNGPGNSKDLVKLELASDGTHLLVGATLAEADRGTMAGTVVELYLDVDNDAATGGKTEYGPAGFEYRAELAVCLKGQGSTTCSGGEEKPQLRFAGTMVERFKGTAGQEMGMMAMEMLVPHTASPQVPLKGPLVQDRIAYRDLGVKSGQVIRIVAREDDAKVEKESLLPAVVLELK